MFDEHEPAEFELTPDLAAIERKLARLTPAAPQIDRDRLMFEAGKAASRPGRPAYLGEPSRIAAKFWPAATGVATAACLLLATMFVWQRQSTQVVLQPPALPIATPPIDARPDQLPLASSVSSTRVPFSNATWPTAFQPTSGYVSDRNFALVRGVSAFESRGPTTDSDDFDQTDELKPLQRQLLNDYLPSS